MNMLATIVPKSDQMNSDDLIGGPRTITVTKVLLTGDEQPVAVRFEGDDGKPYKPCKSMRRVLVQVWGADANAYAGQSMTLYRDDKVAFGGQPVGGIRISHMTGIERETPLMLTTTRGKKAPHVVKPLRTDREQRRPTRDQGQGDDFPGDREQTRGPATTVQAQESPPLSLEDRAKAFEKRIADAATVLKLQAYRKAAGPLLADLERSDPERGVELLDTYDERLRVLEDAERGAR